MNRIYDKVAGNNPGLNRFDLSYTNTTSMKMGKLYVTQCDEVYPGDVFKMSAFVHAEVMPMVAPVMTDMQMFVHSFFCPSRLLYGYADDGHAIFEKFITGDKDGDYDTPLPSWEPSFSVVGFSSGTIWDCIGNPVSYDSSTGTWTPIYPKSLMVSCAPKRAYNMIWNNYYRSEDLNDEVSLDNEYLLDVNFKKDYFTSALLYQQRGTAPALPVDVSFNIPTLTPIGHVASGALVLESDGHSTNPTQGYPVWLNPDNTVSQYASFGKILNGPDAGKFGLFNSSSSEGLEPGYATYFKGHIGSTRVHVDPSELANLNNAVGATTFTPSDLRLAFAIQRMQELSMRSGYRYIEYIGAHFGCHPTDERLDRPEYIGGFVANISVSPSVQTSATGSGSTDQGTKVGIANLDTVQKIGNYRVLEYGTIMTLVSIVPKPIYHQGINRQWLRQNRFMFYTPEMAYLSESAINNCELYCDGLSEGSEDSGVFGFQAAWNELRSKTNMITGAVREQFSYWTTARTFANRPHLNADFLKVVHSDFAHIFAVQDEDPFVVSFSNLIDAYRPLPAMGVPGLIDHVYGGY